MNIIELLEAVKILQELELKRAGIQIGFGYSASVYTDAIGSIMDLIKTKIEEEKKNVVTGNHSLTSSDIPS